MQVLQGVPQLLPGAHFLRARMAATVVGVLWMLLSTFSRAESDPLPPLIRRNDSQGYAWIAAGAAQAPGAPFVSPDTSLMRWLTVSLHPAF